MRFLRTITGALLLFLPVVACTLAPVTTPTPTTPASMPSGGLDFAPDPGFRVTGCSVPEVSVTETGRFYLYCSDGPRQMFAVSEDGLDFQVLDGPSEETQRNDPRKLLLPDGTWRKYIWNSEAGALLSERSTDGLHFEREEGERYRLDESDNGTMGVRTLFVTRAGGVVLLYVGDMGGVNNVRRACSPPGDNGANFTFQDGNPLGDADAGGGQNSYVDPYALVLPDGRVRVFTMWQGPGAVPPQGIKGDIYSFVTDDGVTFTPEPGPLLQPGDFTAYQVYSLNDPKVVLLPDGRYRMYVAAMTDDGQGGHRWVIVSATAAQDGGG